VPVRMAVAPAAAASNSRAREEARAGLPLTAFVQMRCRLDRCLLKTSQSSDHPEITEIHKLTGDYCSMLKVRAASMEHFEGLLERIGQHGEMRTSVVLSTQYEGRPVQPQSDEFLHATHSAGWRSPPAATEPRCRVAAAGRVRPGRRRRGTPGRRRRRSGRSRPG
jgi:DNA-binding Lrp family transcriptional regulator